jgi:hypothetical protein
LKFPDGYAAGFRRAMNLESRKLSGVKSELRPFYRQLYAKEIKKEMMEKMEKEIHVILCKLEKIFPLGWFNPMQHLLIHLPYKARVGVP